MGGRSLTCGHKAAIAASLALYAAVPRQLQAQAHAQAQALADVGPYATERPEYAHLASLEARAAELQLEGAQDAEGRAAIIAAWQALRRAAERTSLPGGGVHPLAHAARVKIASMLYANGENSAARNELDAGLAGLRPYAGEYLLTEAEGVALLGTLLAHGGDAESAMPLVRAGYENFLQHYREIPESDLTSATVLAKSNLEFSLSQVALRLGRGEQALEYQATSLATREGFLGPNHPDTVASYYGYAGALRSSGNMEEAERYARIAVTRAVDHVDPSHPSYARALEMLGIVLSRSGRPIEATDYLLRALELKREHEGSDNLIFGYGIHNLATIFYQRERFADAAPLFVEAESLFRAKQGDDSPFAIGSLAYAGQIDFAEGRYDEAVTRLTALESQLGEASSDLEIAMRITPDLARALIRDGRGDMALAKADGLYERLLSSEAGDGFDLRHAALIRARAASAVDGARLVEAVSESHRMLDHLRRGGITDLGGFVQVEQRAALDLIMEVATLTGDPQLMLSAMALITGSDIAYASALREQRLIDENPELGEAIRRMQDADAALDRADRALLVALAKGADAGSAQSALGAAMAERKAALGALEGQFADWQARTPQFDLPLAELQAALAGDEALLAVVPAYDGAYLLLVTDGQAVARRAAIGRAQLIALARRLRDGTIARQFDEAAAEELGAAIFPPDIRAVLRGRKKLRILAGGPLASLPFATIRLQAGPDDSAGFLIDRFALASLASLTSRFDPVADRPEKLGSFVAFANPARTDAPRRVAQPERPVRGIAAYYGRETPDYAAIAALPPLPRTEDEAKAVARIFAPDRAWVFSGDKASEGAVHEEAVSRADVLMFATHGLVAGEIEGIAEPALVLSRTDGEGPGSDGVLTASEIERLDLSADWVILSACDSAAGMSGGHPAFSGLARAFRYAGANALLVSHWQVRDDAAAFISTEALLHYRVHGDKAAALRHAMVKLREESGLPGADDPAIWAPFVLIEN